MGPAGDVLVATMLVLVVDMADGAVVVDDRGVLDSTAVVVVVVAAGRGALVAGAAVLLDVAELEESGRLVLGAAVAAVVADALGTVAVVPRTTPVADAFLRLLVAPAVVRATHTMAATPAMAARTRQREVAEPRRMVTRG
ncbi:MAG: hypothetical protein ABIR68_15900 [Ilumatobacteraceae bacterium]